MSRTHTSQILLLSVCVWVLGFKTHRFVTTLPSAAPSVRCTEGAARHFSAASNLKQWSILVTALLRRRDESSWILATTISDSMTCCWILNDIPEPFFLHGRRLGGRQEEAAS